MALFVVCPCTAREVHVHRVRSPATTHSPAPSLKAQTTHSYKAVWRRPLGFVAMGDEMATSLNIYCNQVSFTGRTNPGRGRFCLFFFGGHPGCRSCRGYTAFAMLLINSVPDRLLGPSVPVPNATQHNIYVRLHACYESEGTTRSHT